MKLQWRTGRSVLSKLISLFVFILLLGGLFLSGLSSLPLAQAATSGYVAAWGFNGDGETNVPAGLNNVTAIAAGTSHSLALKSDGSVVAWGDNDEGQLNIPGGLSNVTAIAAGYHYSLALKNDGTVVGWGDNSYGQINTAGLSNVTAISAAYFHSLALKSDGTVVAWGSNVSGESTVPAGLSNVTAIAAGYYHSLALKSDGTVVGWGDNGDGQSNTTGLSNVTAISAGVFHSLALKSDGTVVAWGDNFFGQSAVPAGLSNVTAISAGGYHSLALKSDGTVVGWSRNNYGENTTPAGLSGFTAIAGGYGFSLGIYTDGTPPTTSASTNPASPNGSNGWFKSNVTVNLSATDNSGGSGVKSITYSLNNGTPTTVNSANTNVNITTEGTTTVRYFATDNVGNSEATKTLIIKLDKTAPTITASAKKADGTVYTPGSWTNQAVTVSFNCSDATSGISGSCPANQVFSTDGSFTANGSVSDNAGNTGNTSLEIKIDQTAPTASPTQSPAANANGWNNTDVIVSWNWTDKAGGSGIDSANCTTTSTSSGEGSLNLTATCKDLTGSLGNASYTVKVDKTAPGGVTGTAERAPDAGDYYNHPVKISFSGTDATSGIASCTNSTYSGPDSNSVTVNGSCTDLAGNTTTTSFSLKYDATKPVSTATATPSSPDGNNGFYKSDVTVKLDVTDSLSGVKEIVYSVNGGSNVTTPGATVTLPVFSSDGTYIISYFATDNAANSETTKTLTIKLDKTGPSGVTGTPERAPDAGGYYNRGVKVTFSGSDATSGIANCTSSTYNGPDSNTVTVNGSCTDNAGNSTSGSFSLKYDATKPTTVATLPTATNGFYKANVTVKLDATDNLSGVKSITYSLNGGIPTVINAATTNVVISAEGTTTLTFFATDIAGNVEVSQSRVIKIDLTMPEFDLYFDKDSRRLILKTMDGGSGVATAPIALPSSTVNNPAPYELKDTAGNSLKIYFRRITSNSGNTFVGVEFKKLEYSNGTILNLDNPYNENTFKVEYDPKSGQPLKEANQSYSVQGAFNVLANYTATKNQTKITIKVQSQAAINRTDSGLTLLHAISDKGKLTFKVGN